MKRDSESGVVLMAVVIILLPVIVTVGAFSATMTSRTERLVDEVDQEKALLAAESGIDLAIWRGQAGALTDGYEEVFALGADTSARVRATHLRRDSRDNDGDGAIDEADEDVFQVVSSGSYRGTVRNVAAYLGPLPRPPLDFPSAVVVMNPDATIELSGTPDFNGSDHNLDGSRGDAANDVYGIAMTEPGTAADLQGEIDAGEASHVAGVGGAPSLGTAPPIDVDAIVTFVENSANNVLTNSRYSSLGSTGPGASITYRNGDLAITGNARGAGIMVVTGDLTIGGTFRYDGILIVLGDVTLGAGDAQLFGTLVQGPAGASIDSRGTLLVQYSTEALALAASLTGRYVAFNGWQELAR